MKTTYLIQRVSKPRRPLMVGGKEVFNPFTFGCGLLNGGLQPEAMALFTTVLSFDYMGASEFEHGALPEALTKMVNYALEEGLVFESIDIKLKDVKLDWVAKRDVVSKAESGTLYVICAKTDKEEVCRRVTHIAKNERSKHPDINLKESARLSDALKIEDPESHNSVGGLELDNGFFVTVDKEMAEKFFAIFPKPETKEAA